MLRMLNLWKQGFEQPQGKGLKLCADFQSSRELFSGRNTSVYGLPRSIAIGTIAIFPNRDFPSNRDWHFKLRLAFLVLLGLL